MFCNVTSSLVWRSQQNYSIKAPVSSVLHCLTHVLQPQLPSLLCDPDIQHAESGSLFLLSRSVCTGSFVLLSGTSTGNALSVVQTCWLSFY